MMGLSSASPSVRRTLSPARHRAHAQGKLADGTITRIMSDLPAALFSNPVWHALHGPHRHLAIGNGRACRYPADVCPFAAIVAATSQALDELRLLLATDESVWIVDYGQTAPGLNVVDALECVQMVLPGDVEPRAPSGEVLSLSPATAHEMVALTDLAFPGFFRSRTYLMGSYCGVRLGGELIAMGGERLRLEGYPELSGICTHPAHRGKGLASDVIGHLVGRHRRDGLRSWLHVGAPNKRAINLYESLGFKPVRTLMLHRIVRTG
jgi:ribosomal protein S18 acetylase RimI-like enzyme